jgi:outer membrane protein OmpA-like peptidoglycan-associated protein
MGTNARPIGTSPVRFDSGRPAITLPRAPTDEEKALALLRHVKRLGPHASWKVDKGIGVTLELRDFAQGGTQLRGDFGQALDDAAQFLLESPRRRVWIGGYADARESRNEKTLYWLSYKRAMHVWYALAQRKVPVSQLLEMTGQGEKSALFQGNVDPGKFRMVEVKLLALGYLL